ncbi:LruC domain-containing protein [Winogradskyella sp. PG-2]|uniref:LruC domain-containing protein n=1 Tax=Winogradskyella sp. PG-2 TaxID=754409 RepID=UPI00045870D0|nr:LruC domain-containing protein [Winogradskyella sp. PG-2]BAO75980.1 hypothetical protein WPG_1750 [Winogradskyella sp. PG-2]
MKELIKIGGSIALLLLFTCTQPEIANDLPEDENLGSWIDIPSGFDYSTHESVNIKINDNSNAVYEVFVTSNDPNFLGSKTFIDESGNTVTDDVYREDIINKQVLKGIPKNGILEQLVTLPKYCEKVYIRRNNRLNFSGEFVNVVNGEVNYTFQNSAGRNTTQLERNGVNDYLYCVNGQGELFQIDPLNGDLTMISEMPMGSWTAAIDQESLMLYSIGRSSPYPLMRYSIENDEWSTVANLGMGGPRLAYNSNDNLLYFSDNNGVLFTINPISGAILNSWQIIGLHNTTGGDIDFAEDGTIYVCTFSGLYSIELNQNNDYIATRISADNLPFQPTSMTIDSNQELWLANNGSNSSLIIMDTTTGGWQYQYGIGAGNNTNFNRTINDLTTLRVYSDSVDTTDTDGDGIIDSEDSYPDDSEKAFEVFTPSKYGKGTIAFEDLWPTYGDYDFNDLAFSYRAIVILNSDNEVVQVDLICRVKANGAGYDNGFGIEIDGLLPDQVESVTGTTYSSDYITLNANGTEANQDKAVIILTDNADNFLNERTVSITLTAPVSTSELGVAPFNPFIIINQERHKEVHLPNRDRTNLGTNVSISEGINSDIDGNFISDNGMPWGISIIHDFKVPKENTRIDNAYNFFVAWATSGGATHNDWYKDNPGFRNENLLDN